MRFPAPRQVFVSLRPTVFVVLIATLACSRGEPAPPAPRREPAPPQVSPALVAAPRPRPPPLPAEDVLPAAPELPPERRAIQIIGDEERVVDAAEARARGMVVVDLSDGWAPAVLDDVGYRAVFTGLATDRSDGDGQPLAAGQRNYLELYGIPPAPSVLRRRFLEDAAGGCARAFDPEVLLAVDEIRTWGATSEQKEIAKHRARGQRLEAARAAAGVVDLQTLAEKDPRRAKEVKEHERFESERAVFAEVEKRLICERLLDARKHKPGVYDTAMRTAMLDFQQKHAIMDQADIRRSTLDALARPPLDNDFSALQRVLVERTMHAGGFIEDGSANSGDTAVGPTYPGADGARHRVADFASAARDATLAALGIMTADDAVAFFRRHSRADFEWLKVAVRMPPAPEYYSSAMDLSVEIDRGDVWYDFPFDAAGVRQPQPRERFPSFTLYVKWRGERVPLVRWRTTIGGWRGELAADGQEYYRYKGSDVGPRVWRHIVAAPVWIPPSSSPLGSMVKEKLVAGMYTRVTNYDETGPGYLSAYGLVAAIHEEMRKGPDGARFFDNGIRTHGSFDYMSLRGRFSHGCHRLNNQLALRLYSFVLRHRRFRVSGPVALGFRRSFYSAGEVFEMRLPTRGFYRELQPPIPVDVLEGRIRGTQAKPVAGYVPKPGVTYVSRALPAASNAPDDKAGGEPP